MNHCAGCGMPIAAGLAACDGCMAMTNLFLEAVGLELEVNGKSLTELNAQPAPADTVVTVGQEVK